MVCPRIAGNTWICTMGEFFVAINRAVDSCKTQHINIDDHFREVTKMIEIGKGDKREISKRTIHIEINN